MIKRRLEFQKLIWLLALSILCVNAAPAQSLTDKLAQGVVIEKVVVATDPTQSYALYLPSTYDPHHKYPILYCFDPGARGAFPVTRFKEAAEQSHYILVGSNNSRNGPHQPFNDIIKSFWEDTHARLSIDERQVYFAGFSGGARVAISSASLLQGLVSGVIACSGGWPTRTPPTPLPTFLIFATAGLEDFNNPEMLALAKSLEKSTAANRLRVFDGAHEWLPASLAGEALEWFEIQAMRAGRKEKDDAWIDSALKLRISRAREAEARPDNYRAYLLYESAADDFAGLRLVDQYRQRANELAATKEVREALKREKQYAEEQLRRLQKIHALMQTLEQPDTELSVVGDLRDLLANQKKGLSAPERSFERVVAKRVVEALMVESFEQGNLALFQKNYAQAIRHFSLPAEIQPDNPRVYYHLARALALARENKKALAALQKAVEKGFNDADALSIDEFKGLQNDRKFQELLGGLKRTPAND